MTRLQTMWRTGLLPQLVKTPRTKIPYQIPIEKTLAHHGTHAQHFTTKDTLVLFGNIE